MAKRKAGSRVKAKVSKKAVAKAKPKSKYKKEYIELWQCCDCDFQWAYRTIKCPLCYGVERTKIM